VPGCKGLSCLHPHPATPPPATPPRVHDPTSVGRVVEAAAVARSAVALFRQVQDGLGLALSLILLGGCLSSIGQLDEAVSATTEALSIHRRHDGQLHQAGLIRCLNNLGMTLQALGRMDEAVAALGEAVERAPRGCPTDAQVRARCRRNLRKAVSAERRTNSAMQLRPKPGKPRYANVTGVVYNSSYACGTCGISADGASYWEAGVRTGEMGGAVGSSFGRIRSPSAPPEPQLPSRAQATADST
jgi:tetratricopeptide (TPR) repeat protein